MTNWKIEDHSVYDKSFVIDGPLPLIIDNDDVFGPGVEILAQAVVDTLNEHFFVPNMRRCKNAMLDRDTALDGCESYATVNEDYKRCPFCGGVLSDPEKAFAG